MMTAARLPDMLEETLRLVRQVPRGRVTTYGAIAEALGDIRASRFVGAAMSDLIGEETPAWRIVLSSGSIGGHRRKVLDKREKLRGEGIEVSSGGSVELRRYMFKDFRTRYPLRTLRRRQLLMRRNIQLEHPKELIFDRIAGVDVAYGEEEAFAAMITFDITSRKEVERNVVTGVPRFPYIPSYLAFREMPVVSELLGDVDDKTLVMYDGNGVLHPEGIGIASQVGIEFGISTIGVAKKLLCGSPSGRRRRGVREILLNDAVVGYHLAKGTGKGVYVSAGHRISQAEALEFTEMFLEKRVPEPVRAAHMAAVCARGATRHK